MREFSEDLCVLARGCISEGWLPVISSKVETPYIEPVLDAVQQLACGLVAEAVQTFSNLVVQCRNDSE